MDWNALSTRIEPEPGDKSDQRHEPQRDYDRVVFSSAFRRLGGKTQVFPMPKNDFVHTRLTHSLETSCIGRSLAQQVTSGVEALRGFERDIVWSVSAACLAHDIGNPPFGHAGERAIQQFFIDGEGKDYLSDILPAQRRDLEHFNGNALGFDQLAREHNATFGTLAAFAKYPNAATYPSGKPSKFSALEPDLEVMVRALDSFNARSGPPRGSGTLHRDGWRHRSPLAFLTEAADDIAYTILDLEDGAYQGLIPEAQARESLALIAGCGQDGTIGSLRGAAVNALVNDSAREAIRIFAEMEDGNVDKPGQRRESLLQRLGVHDQIKKINADNRKYCYESPEVLQAELASFEIIPGLLRVYIPAFLNGFQHGKHEHIGKLVPRRLHPRSNDTYECILNSVRFVCEMTDRYALETFQILTGRALPLTTRFRSSAA